MVVTQTERWQYDLEPAEQWTSSRRPADYFGQIKEVQGVPIDDPLEQDSKLLFLYLRYQAWCGQSVDTDSPRAPRVVAAYRWTKLLIETASPAFVAEIAGLDRRFYEQGEIVDPANRIDQPKTPCEKPKSWKTVLPGLKAQGCDVRHLTPIELELALVVFDWWHDSPRLASWLFIRPEILRDVEQFLLKRYCWPLLKVLRAARATEFKTNDSAPDGIRSAPGDGLKCDFTRFRAGRFPKWPWRLFGIIAIGFLTTFSVDPLQHLIWFGPWVISVLLACVAIGFTWLLGFVDVCKQHYGEISDSIAGRRACSLSSRLWLFSFLFSLLATWVLFTASYADFPDGWFLINRVGTSASGEVLTGADMYLEEHPLQTLIGKTASRNDDRVASLANSVGQWFVASFTLGSLSALFGITVQWLWEDKSAIEPI